VGDWQSQALPDAFCLKSTRLRTSEHATDP